MNVRNSKTAAQHSVPEVLRDNAPEPRQSTPGLVWWESARFQAISWLEAGSVKAALSRPSHQRVPHEEHMWQAASRSAVTSTNCIGQK